VHDAEQALREHSSCANLSRLIVALSQDRAGGHDTLPEGRRPQAIARDFTKMMNDVRRQSDERSLADCLESWEMEFDVDFMALLDNGVSLTRPVSNVLVRLHVLNMGAQRILEQKRQQQTLDSSEQVRQRVASIESEISQLRASLTGMDPVQVQLSPNVTVELGSLDDFDERVWVGRAGWGGTCVNYTAEGLILDVLAQDDPDAVHTASIPRDELEGSDSDEEREAPSARPG